MGNVNTLSHMNIYRNSNVDNNREREKSLNHNIKSSKKLPLHWLFSKILNNSDESA